METTRDEMATSRQTDVRSVRRSARLAMRLVPLDTGGVSSVSISLDLVSLVLGIILGINLLLLYERLFKRVSKREQMLSQRVRELERRLNEKDRLVQKAIKAAANDQKRVSRRG
jgi:cell division protein ZapA (FtsZ GTPase activity inhibitor)